MLDSLGLDPTGASKIPSSRPKALPSTVDSKSKTRKRKAAPVKVESDGPRRRSGRLAGLEAEGEELKAKIEEEEKEREVLRVVSRRTRETVMRLGDMMDETSSRGAAQLVGLSPSLHPDISRKRT